MHYTAIHYLANFFACPDALQLSKFKSKNYAFSYLQGSTIANSIVLNYNITYGFRLLTGTLKKLKKIHFIRTLTNGYYC